MEEVLAVGGATAVFLALGVFAQACASLAREKQQHSAELIAIAPAGGPSMIFWKAAAIPATQCVAIALVVLMLLMSSGTHSNQWIVFSVRTFVMLSALMALTAGGMAFSLVSRSGLSAALVFTIAACVLGPTLYQLLSYIWHSILVSEISSYQQFHQTNGTVLFAFGLILLLVRNVFIRAASMNLFLGVALVAAGFLAITQEMYDPFGLSGSWKFEGGEALMIGGMLCAFTLSCIIGAIVNYRRVFLKGVRAKS